MPRPRRAFAHLALALALMFSVGACAMEPRRPTSISITWLAVKGSGGGATGTTTISREKPKEKGDFRVEFSANEVGGIGSQSQAGAWNAAIISTLLLGQPLEGQFRFETNGSVDGPSAGALTTAGLIALTHGDPFLEHITMTGTINSTGTIGPVGGIPEKIQAAADADFTTVLIPIGQRTSTNQAGEPVDVIREGDRLGVTVIEVADIYEAYEHLTGKNIDVPGVPRDPRLSTTAYDKVKPQTDAAMARYSAASARYDRLPADIRNVFEQLGLITMIHGYAAQSEDLQRQGLQAGAYQMAYQAATFFEAVTSVGEMLVPLYTQGLPGLNVVFSQSIDIGTAEREFFSFVDRLSAYNPKTVSDVEGLVNGFAGAFDAYSLLTFANENIRAAQAKWEAGQYADLEALFSDLTMPVLWSQLARSQLAAANASFEVGRDNPGAAISASVNLEQLGSFFRRGADANFAAFRENVVTPLADARGLSPDRVLTMLSNVDLDVAAAVTQSQVQPAIEDYVGGHKPNSQYATLGYGLHNYVRNQMLLDKYYNNAVLDDALNVVDVTYDAVLARTLDLGRQHLAGEIGMLAEHDTEPVVSIAQYEVAGLYRAGNVSEQFGAASMYQGGFLTARTLAYLAGLTGTGKR